MTGSVIDNDAVSLSDAPTRALNMIEAINDALDVMLTSSHGVVVVTGRRNSYQGVIRVETIMDAMGDLRRNEQPTGTPS